MKVSIITVTYNDKENLKKALESINRQDYEKIESIIVDGKSTDGSVDIIKEFQSKFSGDVKWVSEADNGIQDAVNKGIQMATGDYITIFNDIYLNNHVVSDMMKLIKSENADGAHADLIYAKEGEIIRYWKMGEGVISGGWMPASPTLFLKKRIYEECGLYNTQYKCSSDFDFIVRVYRNYSKNTFKLVYYPHIIICMTYGGTSNQSKSAYLRSITESIDSLRKNGYFCPVIIVLKRIIKTYLQFRNTCKVDNNTLEEIRKIGV